MASCETCRAPGRCCSGFPLNSSAATNALNEMEVQAWLDQVLTPPLDWNWGEPDRPDQEWRVGLPFRPLFKDSTGAWRYWCTLLTPEGRCGDYEHRPWLCSHFQPGSDPLCIEFEKEEA
jgi:Fe-S-cluster containining protein